MVMAWSVDRLGRSLQDLVGFLSAQLAFLIGRGLVKSGDSEVDNRPAHGSALTASQVHNSRRSKMVRFIGISTTPFRDVFSYRPERLCRASRPAAPPQLLPTRHQQFSWTSMRTNVLLRGT